MRPRVTLALVLSAAALGGGYWYWEVKTKPAREAAAEDAKKLFPDLKSSGTGEILVRVAKKPDVLLRKVGEAWQLISPVQAPADKEAVDGILEQLKSVKREEVVEDKATDLRKFGLDDPSGAITFKPLSGKAQVLFFGADNFDGSKAYGMVDGQPGVFLAVLASKTALLKDADGLREKRLLLFDPAKLGALRSSKGFSVEKDKQGYWQVKAGAQVEPAKQDKVTEWITALQGIKGESVAEEKAASPGKYGLGAAKVELALNGAPGLTLQKGKLKDKGPSFYGRVMGQTQVWVLPSSAAAALDKDARALMDLQAFAFKPGLVEGLSVWHGGVTITAKRNKDLKWAWDPPYKPKPGVPAFGFEDFVAKVSGTERLGRLPESALPKEPALVVTFYGADNSLLERAVLGPAGAKDRVAQSAMKKMVMRIPANVFEGLP